MWPLDFACCLSCAAKVETCTHSRARFSSPSLCPSELRLQLRHLQLCLGSLSPAAQHAGSCLRLPCCRLPGPDSACRLGLGPSLLTSPRPLLRCIRCWCWLLQLLLQLGHLSQQASVLSCQVRVELGHGLQLRPLPWACWALLAQLFS